MTCAHRYSFTAAAAGDVFVSGAAFSSGEKTLAKQCITIHAEDDAARRRRYAEDRDTPDAQAEWSGERGRTGSGVAGLHLQVTERGARSWILRATIGDRRRDIGLGGYPDTTLEQARALARDARLQIRQGMDPVEARKAAQEALRTASAQNAAPGMSDGRA